MEDLFGEALASDAQEALAGPRTIRGSSLARVLVEAPAGSRLVLTNLAVAGPNILHDLAHSLSLVFNHCTLHEGIDVAGSTLGELSLNHCEIIGSRNESYAVSFSDARIRTLTIAGLTHSDSGAGQLNVDGAHSRIHQLDIRDSSFANLTLDDATITREINLACNTLEYASLTRITVSCASYLSHDHGIFLDNVASHVDLSGAIFSRPAELFIGTDVDLTGSRFSASLRIFANDHANVRLRDAVVAGSFVPPRRENGKATIDISGSRIRELLFNSRTSTLPRRFRRTKTTIEFDSAHITATRPVDIGGIGYSSTLSEYHGARGRNDVPTAQTPTDIELKVLARSLRTFLLANAEEHSFQPSLAHAVAAALRNEERPNDAAALERFAVDQVLRNRPRFGSRVWHIVSKVTIGHGFSPLRAFAFLLLTWIAAALITTFASDTFTNIGDDGRAPGFWSVLYALDVVVSPIGTGQSDFWIATSLPVSLTLWVLKILAWGFGFLFVSGLLGWVNKSAADEGK